MSPFRYIPLLALAAWLLAALIPAGPARAATITVNSLLDAESCGDGVCTLREAVENADADMDISCGACAAGSGADIIVFSPALAGGTIPFSGLEPFGGDWGDCALSVNSEILIQGDERRGLTITRDPAAPYMRLFTVKSGGSLTLRNLTLSGGVARGGNGGGGGLSGSGGGGAGLGGAILVGGVLTVENCTFTGNLAQGGNSGSTIGNETQGGAGGDPHGGSAGNPDGGDGLVGGGGGGGDVVLSSSGNGGAGGFGGGGGGGGGGHDGTGGTGGSGGFGGGNGANGITAYGASTYGSGGCGGGGAGMGGAIFIAGLGEAYVSNSTFSGNQAMGGASGPASGASGGAGSGLGGAIFNLDGFLKLVNVTMADNRADQGGGGVCAVGDVYTSQNTIANTIIADSVSGVTDFQAQIIHGGALATVGGFNLMESASGFGGGIYSSADPNLGPLAANGGPTLTHAFAGPSDAIDHGNNIWADSLTADQRGFQPRDVNGTVDIGAYEQGAVKPFPAAAGGPVLLLLDQE